MPLMLYPKSATIFENFPIKEASTTKEGGGEGKGELRCLAAKKSLHLIRNFGLTD